MCFSTLTDPLTGACHARGSHGFALLYAAASPHSSHAIGATIALPRVRGNRSWYAAWIMIVSKSMYGSGELPQQTFVQIGLIRRPEVDAYLHAFVAYKMERPPVASDLEKAGGFRAFTVTKPSSTSVNYKDLGAVTEGNHVFSIELRADHLTFRMDHQKLPIRLLYVTRPRYYQLGNEISSVGEHASGVLTNPIVDGVQVKGPNASPCTYHSKGLRVVWDGRELKATNAHNESASGFSGDCAGL
jgi:hypothetical protein